MRFLNACCALSLTLGLCATSSGAQAQDTETFECKPVPEPVVSLSYGSRYVDDDKSRSEIDEAGNEAVDKALKPVDAYISAVTKMANDALTKDAFKQERVDCVVQWLDTWAKAEALGELETLNARISVGPRVGALAIALYQAERAHTIDPAIKEPIAQWLAARTEVVRDTFETDAGPRTKVNNLRAWAGLSAIAVGMTTAREDLLDWGAKSYETVVCTADAEGALPAEMGRKQYALHYQLHALNALAMSAYFLDQAGRPSVDVCEGKLKDIVKFTLAAAKDPGIVDEIAKAEQTYSSGKDEIEAFELAWAEPYLTLVEDAELEAYIESFRPLGNSKLGGNLTRLVGLLDRDGPENNS